MDKWGTSDCSKSQNFKNRGVDLENPDAGIAVSRESHPLNCSDGVGARRNFRFVK
jgi:hypothetical protein